MTDLFPNDDSYTLGEESTTEPALLAQRILLEMLEEAPRMAEQTHRILMPISDFRNNLREKLLTAKEIFNYSNTPSVPTTLAATDGARLQNEKYAVDELWAVAVSSNGMTSTEALPLASAHWGAILPHNSGNSSLGATAMAILELKILGSISHSLRIMDGSFQTPYIALLKSFETPAVVENQEYIIDLYRDNLEHIKFVADPNAWGDSRIIALPKSDSSQDYFYRYQSYMDKTPPVAPNDKFLASQLLSPGEMLYPRHAEEIASMGISNLDNIDSGSEFSRIAIEVSKALHPLREKASKISRKVGVFYFKPLTADTVIKVEYVSSEPIPTSHQDPHGESPAIQEAKIIAKQISDETPGPHLQEPFAQYNVDLIAKQISPGATMVFDSMINHLPEESEPYLQFLNRGYRS